MNKFKSLIPSILILLFEAVIGVLMIIFGERFNQAIIIAFGALMIIGAIVTLIRGLIARRKEGGNGAAPITAALIMALIGIFFVAASGFIMPAIMLVLGVIMAINGIFKISEFFLLRREGNTSVFNLISAIITIILGFVIAFNPFGASDVMWKIVGILITVSAAIDLIALIYIFVKLKKVPQKTVDVEGKEVDDQKRLH